MHCLATARERWEESIMFELSVIVCVATDFCGANVEEFGMSLGSLVPQKHLRLSLQGSTPSAVEILRGAQEQLRKILRSEAWRADSQISMWWSNPRLQARTINSSLR